MAQMMVTIKPVIVVFMTIIVTCINGGDCSVLTPVVCSGDADCGWNSYCEGGQCWCVSGFQKSQTSSDCLDVTCTVKDCVECLDAESCRRCKDFIDGSTGQCLSTCPNSFSLIIEGTKAGKVCQGSSKPSLNTFCVAVVIGAVASCLLVVLLTVLIHHRISNKKESDLQAQLMEEILRQNKETSESASCPQFAGSDSHSLDSAFEDVRLKRLHYNHQVAALKPHLNTFLLMLRDAKTKCQKLGAEDSRQLLYRNLIHQLCRVLTVLTDRMTAVPPDGNLLMDWGHRLLRDYLKSHKSQKSDPEDSVDAHTSQSTLVSGRASTTSSSLWGRSGQLCNNGKLRSQQVEQDHEVEEISGADIMPSFGRVIQV